jgi:hypothetical protein
MSRMDNIVVSPFISLVRLLTRLHRARPSVVVLASGSLAHAVGGETGATSGEAVAEEGEDEASDACHVLVVVGDGGR